jgi:hypothetical protein
MALKWKKSAYWSRDGHRKIIDVAFRNSVPRLECFDDRSGSKSEAANLELPTDDREVRQ